MDTLTRAPSFSCDNINDNFDKTIPELFTNTENESISKIYTGSFSGEDGDLVYTNSTGKQFIVNTNTLQYIVASGEFSEEKRQMVFNLIALLNLESHRIVKVWTGSKFGYWTYSNFQQSIRFIFPNFPNANKISYIIEKR